MPSFSVMARCSARTRSRMVYCGKCMCGCDLLFEGEEETPFANASMKMVKSCCASIMAAYEGTSCSVVPPAQVVMSTTLDFWGLRVPRVRYPRRQSWMACPLSRGQSPSSMNCCGGRGGFGDWAMEVSAIERETTRRGVRRNMRKRVAEKRRGTSAPPVTC